MQCDCKKVSTLLKTAKGQIDGIIRMIDDDRYCIDVVNQVMATQAILKKVNQHIIKGHMEHCVREAAQSGDIDKKLDEISVLLERMSK